MKLIEAFSTDLFDTADQDKQNAQMEDGKENLKLMDEDNRKKPVMLTYEQSIEHLQASLSLQLITWYKDNWIDLETYTRLSNSVQVRQSHQ